MIFSRSMNRLYSPAILVSLLAASTIALPWSPDSLQSQELGSRDTLATIAITGVNDGGPVHPRLEIRTLKQKADQWNLYLLAMQAFQAMNQSAPLGWYQVAGIHGVPNIPWDNVQANPKSGGAVGYCTHSSVLFPTWHRAYLALFEQAFYTCVQNVVASFPPGATHDKYALAAISLRIPYWDWAETPTAGQPVVPACITDKYISGLVTPSGVQNNVINPLFRYTFHPLVPSDMMNNPWATWPITLRYPTSASSTNAASQSNLVTSVFDSNQKNIRDSVYNMFTLCGDYSVFSNDAATSSSASCYTSLEGIHDTIHVNIGGSNNGHMTYLWWAAFDPVFFLHHANVDRLFALWQAIYPNSYLSPTAASGNTYTTPNGSILDQNSPLTPFHSDTQGTFWTSSGVRNMNSLHYTYPEFMSTDGSSTAIISVVNKLYGPSPSVRAPAKRQTSLGSISYDYIMNIQAQRFALDGSFIVYAFLGGIPVSSSAIDWLLAPSCVGSHGFFSTPGMSSQMEVTGAVPLTSALHDQVTSGALASMHVRDVVPYLKAKLFWAVARTSDGIPVAAVDVPGLQISIVTAAATKANNDNSFPLWGAWTTLANITQGRAGGVNS